MLKKTMIILAAAMLLLAAVEVSAQGVIMNSAETINQGNLKLAVFPTVLFGKGGNDPLFGVAARFGYGFLARVDVEAKVAFFKDIKYFGADVEFWFIKGHNFNASAAIGGHMTKDARIWIGNSAGADAVLLVSTAPVKNLEIYGGLMLAYDKVNNVDLHYTRVHFVPGIEFRLTQDLDFLAEVGIALNGDARSYASVGLALYLLR